MCNGVFVITLRKCGTNGRTRFVFIAPRVCFVGVGGIPTAGEDVTDVNFVGCGLAERTDTAPVIVYNNCCAVRNIIKIHFASLQASLIQPADARLPNLLYCLYSKSYL